MTDDNVKTFLHRDITPHAVLSHFQSEIKQNNVVEVYLVLKDKDGNYNESISGEMGGLAFSIIVLLKKALEAL